MVEERDHFMAPKRQRWVRPVMNSNQASRSHAMIEFSKEDGCRDFVDSGKHDILSWQ